MRGANAETRAAIEALPDNLKKRVLTWCADKWSVERTKRGKETIWVIREPDSGGCYTVHKVSGPGVTSAEFIHRVHWQICGFDGYQEMIDRVDKALSDRT